MKLDRLLSIALLLLQRDRISASKLAEMFEVTRRTIFRDIEALNRAGVPIVTYPGARGGIGIMENYKIEKKLFTGADVATLLLGLYTLQASMPDEQVRGTIAKVESLVSEEQLAEIRKNLTVDQVN